MRTTLLSACFAFALSAAPSLRAQLCLDQEYVPTSGNGLEVTDRQSVAQTFTVGIEGQLAELELLGMRHHRALSTFDLRWELVTTDANGAPTAEVLANGVIPPSALSFTPATLRLDLRPFALAVVAGELLAVHLETDSPSGGATYAWAGDAPASYAGGSCYIRRNLGPLSYDMGFRTQVEKSPGLLLSLEQVEGPGSLRIRHFGGVAGEFFVLAISFDPTNAAPNTGTGPWGGLYIALPELITQVQLGPPFVGAFDASGRTPETSFPAGTLPPFYRGRTLWAVTRSLSAASGFTADSNLVELRLR